MITVDDSNFIDSTAKDRDGKKYAYHARRDSGGFWFVEFIELQGCISQTHSQGDVARVAHEILQLWLDTVELTSKEKEKEDEDMAKNITSVYGMAMDREGNSFVYRASRDDNESAWFVKFPELDGCVGQTMHEACIDIVADEILQLWLDTEEERQEHQESKIIYDVPSIEEILFVKVGGTCIGKLVHRIDKNDEWSVWEYWERLPTTHPLHSSWKYYPTPKTYNLGEAKIWFETVYIPARGNNLPFSNRG